MDPHVRLSTTPHGSALAEGLCGGDFHALAATDGATGEVASATNRLAGMPPHFHFGLEAIAALEAVGMGRAGKPNCLIDMILEACETIRSLPLPPASAGEVETARRDVVWEVETHVSHAILTWRTDHLVACGVRVIDDDHTQPSMPKKHCKQCERIVTLLAAERAASGDNKKGGA